jgi:hypothetical protein
LGECRPVINSWSAKKEGAAGDVIVKTLESAARLVGTPLFLLIGSCVVGSFGLAVAEAAPPDLDCIWDAAQPVMPYKEFRKPAPSRSNFRIYDPNNNKTQILANVSLSRTYRICVYDVSYETTVLTGPADNQLSVAGVIPSKSCADFEAQTVAVKYDCKLFNGNCATRPPVVVYCRKNGAVKKTGSEWWYGWSIALDDFVEGAHPDQWGPISAVNLYPLIPNEIIPASVPIFIGQSPQLYVVSGAVGLIALVDGKPVTIDRTYQEIYGRKIEILLGTIKPIPGRTLNFFRKRAN